jgi:hypothetical protein
MAKQNGIGSSFDWCLAPQPAGTRTRPGIELFIDAQINCSLMHKPIVMAYTYLYYWETALGRQGIRLKTMSTSASN